MNGINKGEKYITRALEIHRDLGFPYELASVLIQISEATALNFFNQALEYSQETLAISLNNNLNGSRELCYNNFLLFMRKKEIPLNNCVFIKVMKDSKTVYPMPVSMKLLRK